MPDQRQHRGRHPADSRLFASAEVPVQRQATEELSWLFERGYSQVAALKLDAVIAQAGVSPWIVDLG